MAPHLGHTGLIELVVAVVVAGGTAMWVLVKDTKGQTIPVII